jgi:hypothetical protein
VEGTKSSGCSMSSLISLLSSWVYQTFPVSKGDTSMKRDYSRLSFTCMDCELGCLFVNCDRRDNGCWIKMAEDEVKLSPLALMPGGSILECAVILH